MHYEDKQEGDFLKTLGGIAAFTIVPRHVFR